MPFDFPFDPDQIFEDFPVITHNDGTQTVTSPNSEYKLPDHITVHRFFTRNGIPVRFYTAKAKNETTMVLGASGFKTDFILSPSEIEALNDTGISVAWLAIPNPGRNPNFMQHIIEAAEETLINPRHQEIRSWCARPVPKIFFGHSTGAQLFLRMATDGHHKKLNSLFSGAILSSPYITPPATENPYAPSTILFNSWTWKNSDQLPSETWLGRAYTSDSERAEINTSDNAKYQEPTCPQIQELRKGGTHVLKGIRNTDGSIHSLSFPFLIAAGAKDKFSSPQLSSEIAATMEASFYYANDKEHSPLSGSMEGIEITIRSIQSMANGSFKDFSIQRGIFNYNVEPPKKALTKLALSAMPQLSLPRLKPHMPSVFSRKPS